MDCRRDAFSGFHPVVNFLYFLFAISFSMVFMHPVCLTVTLVMSLICSGYLNGRRSLIFNLKFMLPLLIVAAVINPAFNHVGMTILTYLPGGNPLTAESIIYGFAAAVMIISVINWFSCFNTVITTDKLVYLFGRIIPSMSLIFSMTLRFVPRLRNQLKEIEFAQECAYGGAGNNGFYDRLKRGAQTLSIMMTWALENAIETADSMKCRGYGLHGRTSFSIYRFERRDICAGIFIIACAAYIITGIAVGGLYIQYFPRFEMHFGIYGASAALVYAALLFFPAAAGIWEDRKWKSLLNSEI